MFANELFPSGLMAKPRTPIASSMEEEQTEDAQAVDASLLPPG
jgi:hypothetical protein